ncbi:MAG: ATP-binding protein [Clostridiales bacterium]|nr:ATP-binding protein [Clostridiales bacterium]
MTTEISSPADSFTKFTTEEIKKFNIPCAKELPEPTVCKFCGKQLYYEGLMMMGRIVCISPRPQRCTCTAAVQSWAKIDAEEKISKQERERHEKQEKEKTRFIRAVKNSKLSKRHQKCRLNNFVCKDAKQRIAVKKAAEYIKSFDTSSGRGLYIEGTTGTGKTHIAAAIAMELIKRRYSVIMQTTNDLLAEIKYTYDELSEAAEGDILHKLKTVDLLVIDDLGKEQVTAWSMAMLYNIIDSRYQAMLPVIITTNYNETMLKKRLTTADGDSTSISAIVSRLRETTDVISMAWADHRKERKNE